jgi:hypothetical protein
LGAAGAKAFTFFRSFGRIFCGCAAKNRAIKATGGCQGSGFASGPAYGVAAPHPSYPLRRPKAASVPLLGLGFCFAKPQEITHADILSAIHADFRLSEFALRANSKDWKQPASMPA